MGDCVLDATLLITLGSADAIDVLTSSTLANWHLTPIVREELLSRKTKESVERAILDGKIRLAELDLSVHAENAAWAKWSRMVDPGEAEAIALAQVRGWRVALEDRQAQRAIQRELGVGRWINSANLLLDGLQNGRLTLAEGDAMFYRLDCYKAYIKRGIISLAQLREP